MIQNGSVSLQVRYFVQKPYPVEAVQWDGNNTAELIEWAGGIDILFPDHDPVLNQPTLKLQVTSGIQWVRLGSWLARGVHGELFTITNPIIEEDYEETGSLYSSPDHG